MITFSERGVSGSVSGGGQNSYSRAALAHCTAGETGMDVFVAACADTTTFPTTQSVTLPGGSPTTFIRETISVDVLNEEGKAPTWFEVKVPYVMLGQSQQPYATGDSTKQFSIGIQQVNVKAAKGTATQYSLVNPGGSPPDFQNLVNVTPEGEVQGVDLDFPTYTWSESHIVADAAMTNTYIAAINAVIANPINNATFKGCAAGEAKFLGVEGAQRHKGGDWELNFKFAASPNFTSLSIGLFTVTKKGWQYLWCYYQETSQTLGSSKVRGIEIRDCVVNDVYGTSDFSTLGIGTT